jgi:hypothetical protein
MDMKRIPVMIISLILISAVSVMGADTLKKSSNRTKVDGRVTPGEYSYSHSAQNMKVHLNWNGGDLYVAIEAKTAGWVAVGLNAKKMDSAHILIGFVDGSNVVFKEQVGTGHAHRDTKTRYVDEYEMTESRGMTTMEARLPASDIISSGQKTLDLIFASGGDDSLTLYHSRNRQGVSVSLEN